jgi:hypothetical protein
MVIVIIADLIVSALNGSKKTNKTKTFIYSFVIDRKACDFWTRFREWDTSIG